MAGDDAADDLVELRPATAVLLRYRADAEVVVHAANRVGPRVELRRGALWVRAGEEGPGVTVTHGAANVQVRAGAGVIEVNDMEALVVVASGRAAVKGAAPLPRSVLAGQAVALTLDGGFTDPAPLTPAELASDRMLVENLARDNLLTTAEAAVRTAPPEPALVPVPVPVPVDDEPVDVVPVVEPEPVVPEPVVPEPEPVVPEPVVSEPEPEPEPVAIPVVPEPEPAVTVEPAPARPPLLVEPDPEPVPARVSPASALESALAGVGVTDDPKAERVAVATPAVDAPRVPDREPEPASSAADDRRRTRILVGLVILALLIFALVAVLVLGGDTST